MGDVGGWRGVREKEAATESSIAYAKQPPVVSRPSEEATLRSAIGQGVLAGQWESQPHRNVRQMGHNGRGARRRLWVTENRCPERGK